MTAPRLYAARLSTEILLQGGLPILMPTIDTCTLASTSALDQALDHVSDFDWIAFTSRTGINAVCQRLQQRQRYPKVLQQSKLCALGKDQEGLQEWGLQADIVPTEASPAGLVATLASRPGIEHQRILVPCPAVEGIPEPDVIPQFVSDLGQLGLHVTQVPAYATRSLSAQLYAVELDLLQAGSIDVIAFSSAAEVAALLQMIEAKTLRHLSLIACFGPYTAANTKRYGIAVDIVAEDFSAFKGFVDAIAAFFQA